MHKGLTEASYSARMKPISTIREWFRKANCGPISICR
ncbi:hypothetical protein J2Z19_001429 [Ensifer adhaerens]|uniref:Uncharacterized protein n=1 Tax=Ensifer adhaerens TaxID=106592 RepID=A0ACC5SS53_ENSAD|nr:hypothetical protein [Ensifer adhaerens]